MAGIPIPYPLVNGVRYDFTSIDLGIDGLPSVFAGITSIDYNHQLDGKDLRGNRPQSIGRTRGVYTCEASLEMALDEYFLLIKLLAAQGLLQDQGYMEVGFPVNITYIENFNVHDVLISGCRIKKAAGTDKEGGDALMRKVDLHPMLILEDGLPPFQPSKLLL